MSALAVIGRIISHTPIENAHSVQLVSVDCGPEGTWSGVVPINIDRRGDTVVVFLQDALLPDDDPRFSFMAPHKYRVRMRRFLGVPSECLILPNDSGMCEVGQDVTEYYRVKKYQKDFGALGGEVAGEFPSHRCPKTDEENFQKRPDLVQRLETDEYYVTEKADGSSSTAWVENGTLHVCSRNMELREFSQGEKTCNNTYWLVARKYGLDRLPEGFFLQYEVVGPKIQNNPLRLKENEIRVFSLYDEARQCYAPYETLKNLCAELRLPMARLIGVKRASASEGQVLPAHPSSEDIRRFAEIEYAPGVPGEGVVIRALDSSWSFKVLNLRYKG